MNTDHEMGNIIGTAQRVDFMAMVTGTVSELINRKKILNLKVYLKK